MGFVIDEPVLLSEDSSTDHFIFCTVPVGTERIIIIMVADDIPSADKPSIRWYPDTLSWYSGSQLFTEYTGSSGPDFVYVYTRDLPKTGGGYIKFDGSGDPYPLIGAVLFLGRTKTGSYSTYGGDVDFFGSSGSPRSSTNFAGFSTDVGGIYVVGMSCNSTTITPEAGVTTLLNTTIGSQSYYVGYKDTEETDTTFLHSFSPSSYGSCVHFATIDRGDTDFVEEISDGIGTTAEPGSTKNIFSSLFSTINPIDFKNPYRETTLYLNSSTSLTDLIGIGSEFLIQLVLLSTIGITSAATKLGVFYRGLADSIGISDLLNSIRSLYLNLASSLSISTYTGKLLNIKVRLVDNLNISSIITKFRTIIKNITDSLGISSLINRVGTFIRSIELNLDIQDNINNLNLLIVRIYNSIGIEDTINKFITRIVIILDSISLESMFSRVSNFIRTLQSTLGVDDAGQRFRNVLLSIATSLGIEGGTAKDARYELHASESTSITETISNIKSILVTIYNNINTTDTFRFLRNLYSIVISSSISVADSLESLRSVLHTVYDSVGMEIQIAKSRAVLLSIYSRIYIESLLSGTVELFLHTVRRIYAVARNTPVIFTEVYRTTIVPNTSKLSDNLSFTAIRTGIVDGISKLTGIISKSTKR